MKINSITWLEELENLIDVESTINDLQQHHCTYDCVYYDNGCGCKDDCEVLELLGYLTAKANKIIKAL